MAKDVDEVYRGTVLPIPPREKKLNERLLANEAECARLLYSMAAMESSLRRLWAAYSDLEQHLIDTGVVPDHDL